MNCDFIRVRSTKDLTVSLAFIISGVLCMGFVDSESITLLGFFLLVAGIFLMIILKTGYKDKSTGSIYKKTEHYFAQSVKDEIIKQLQSDPTTLSFKEEDKGTGLRLDIYTNGKGCSYYQLFEYIPYKYEPCTKVFKTE